MLHRSGLGVESIGPVGNAAYLQDIRARMRSNLETSIPFTRKGFGDTVQTIDFADNVGCGGCVDLGPRGIEYGEVHRNSSICGRRHRSAQLVTSCAVDQGSLSVYMLPTSINSKDSGERYRVVPHQAAGKGKREKTLENAGIPRVFFVAGAGFEPATYRL